MNRKERREWLESRLATIGSSETPTILNLNKFQTRYDLAVEKLGLTEIDDSEPAGPAKRGLVMEPIIAKMFQEKTGIKLINPTRTKIHPEHKFLSANFDRLTTDKQALVEIKCPNLSTFARCRREGLDPSYIAQVQHQLLWPKLRKAFVVVMSCELWEMFWVEMTPDPELQSMIVEEDRKFFESIQRRELPPASPTHEIEFPDTGATAVVKITSQEWQDAAQELFEAMEILREAQELEKASRGHLMLLMGDATVAEGGGLRAYYQSQKGRVTVDVDRLRADFPQIPWEKYEKVGKPFKTFRPYFLRKK